MPRPKSKTGPKIIPNLHESPEDNPEEGTAVDSSETIVFASMRDDSYVVIRRRDDVEKTMVYHGRLAPEEATEQKINELFGGGFYRAQMFERQQAGKYVVTKTRTFKIPGPYKQPMGPLPGSGNAASTISPGQVAAGPTPNVPAGGGVSANEALNTALVSQVIELLKATREQPKPMPMPWAEIMAALSPVVLKFVEMIASKPGGQDTGMALLTEKLNELSLVVQRQQQVQQAPATNAITDVVSAIKELLSVKDMIEGGDSKPDAESVMFSAIPKLLETMSKGQQSQRPPQLAAGQGQQLAPWQAFLMHNKRALLRSASMGIEPDFAAQVAIEYMPQEMTGVVLEFLKRPDHVELALQTIPELRNFESWTREFFAAGTTLMFEEEPALASEDADHDSEP